MNQSTRRKTRHLLHFLLTWVVICTQITLPLGALLAAVQPTPPMAQAIAQRAGLGDWIADAAGKATAWAQPLWGQPKTAAAQATNSIWGIKNYTDFGYLNAAVSPWTWVTVATLTGGNYNAAAAINRTQGIIFNQSTRVFSLVNPSTGALTALTLTNAGSIPRTLAYNVATYDPETNRYFAALENDQYGHIFTVNTATNQITYVSEKAFGQSLNTDDWVFVNGKVVGLDYGTVETWDITNNTYTETSVTSGSQPGEVAGMWLNADGTLGLADQSTGIQQYSFATNSLTVVAQSNAAFPNGGEPNDLAGALFGLSANLPVGVVNQSYTGNVTAGGGTPPYSNYTATGLPAGLTINAATGAVTGTPTVSGIFPVTFSATDSDNYTTSAIFNITIIASAPGGVATNLAAWYKADGTVGSNQWNDESGNGKHMLAAGDGTAARMPTLEAAPGATNNFNPRVAFLSNADANRKWTMTAAGNNVFANTTTPGTIFNVSSFPDETVYDMPEMYSFEDDDPGINLVTDRNAANDIRVIFQRDNDGSARAGWDFIVPGIAQTSPLLTAHAWNYATGGNTLSFNGEDYTPAYNAMIGATSPRYIFGAETTGAGGEAHSGYTSENIVYSTEWPSNSSERKRINSYLAIKYGITMFGTGTLGAGNTNATFGGTADYLDSASTVIWSGTTANSGYHNNVAGIGRDDASALNQKQSTSTNQGFQPVIGLGTIAASNAANGNSFAADKNFMLWGSNTLSATYGIAYTPTSFTPAAGYFRMSRVWKVQETGTVGNVVVQGTGADHLLVSSDPTFATGVTELSLSSGSATIDFSNGQFFTFGRELVAPGGVSAGLGVWLRADQGSSTTTDGQTVTDWADFGPIGNDVTQPTAANQPKFKEVNLNFNPALEFDGSNDVLYKSDGTTIIPNQTDPVSMLTVSTQRAGSGWWQTLLSFSGAADYPALHWLDGRQALYIDGVQDFRHSVVIPYNTPTMFVARANNATPRDLRMANNGLSNQDTSTVGSGTFPAASGSKLFSVGSELATGSETLNGFINEGIVYNRFLSDAEVNRIHTYFAVKYGITFDNGATNYVATDGTTVIWDATTNSGYKNNIAGIGRDDAEALNQKQSLSINSGFQPTIGLGAIAATNTANTNTFSANKSYLIWGDNGQAASYAASYTPSSFTPAAGYYRMSRVWKVQETGTITNVVVQAANANHLLVSSDPTFASGVTEVAFNSGSATVNFANGQYFTFGQEATGPGGVATNLAFWYKPDAGVSLVSDKVSSWVDQANGIAVTPAAANSGPTYYDTGANLINFNPTLNFVNTTRQDGLRAASGLPAIPNGVSTFSVLLPDDASNRWFLQWGVSGAGYYNNYGHCNANNPGVWTNSHGGCVNNPTTLGPITTPSFLSVRWNSTAGTNQWQLRRNGQLHSGTTTSTALNVPADTALEIGDVNQRTAGNEYVGDISEVIGYTARLSDTDRQKIESYLAIKYGITYMNDANTAAQNYLNAAGATVWDATANSSYSANIAGIGRDDASALQQKQSQSVNSGFQVAIGLGGIATSNAANSNTFSANKSFLVWGNNNGATTLSAAYNGGSNNRVARVWKVQETGTVGAVKVVIPRSAFPTVGLRSLIVHASDPNFGTVDRTYPLVVSGGNYEATVNFNNGDFFTFSSSFTIPEINVTPGTLDFGEVTTGMVSPAQAVTIQNQGEVSLSISNISLSGTDAARFAISSNNCGATLSAGASCTVQITFSPTTAGSRSAQLVITSNDSDEGTVNVALSGRTPGGSGGTPGTYNLAVTKSASVSTATIGVPFTYTIMVLNKGTIAAANVTMTDQLPAGVTFGSANATGGGNCNHSSGTVTCTWAALAGGAAATVTISVTP